MPNVDKRRVFPGVPTAAVWAMGAALVLAAMVGAWEAGRGYERVVRAGSKEETTSKETAAAPAAAEQTAQPRATTATPLTTEESGASAGQPAVVMTRYPIPPPSLDRRPPPNNPAVPEACRRLHAVEVGDEGRQAVSWVCRSDFRPKLGWRFRVLVDKGHWVIKPEHGTVEIAVMEGPTKPTKGWTSLDPVFCDRLNDACWAEARWVFAEALE